MYFANNPADADFCDSVIQAFLKLSDASPEMRMHALVDSAFDEESFAELAQTWKTPPVPVYADTLYSGGLEFGPQLLEIDTTGARAAQAEINRLLDLRGNRPMVSLWITPMAAAALALQWRPFLNVQLEDESSYLLRFADTRALHSLLAVLTPAQHAHFLPAGGQVWMPARNGQFSCTQSPGPERHTPITQLVLDKAQFQTMMDNAEADAIIDLMTEDGATRYASTTGADLYAFVSEQVAHAHQYRITQTPDLVTYCELAWTMGSAFDKDDYVNPALRKVTPSHRLATVLQEVPSKAWARLEARQKVATADQRQPLTQ